MLIATFVAAAAMSALAQDPAAPPPRIPYPHPLITEVLYAVPPGEAGDANPDGRRDAVGDEFVELINPHDRPIQLRGYTITDREQTSRDGSTFTSVRFTFPPLELEPGQVVVVFNGREQTWSGPVGDAARAPEPNPNFHDAIIFTMHNTSERSGFANSGDCIILWSPDGGPLHAIRWGEATPPEDTSFVERAPLVRDSSITRLHTRGPLLPHSPREDGRRFSPGRFPHD